MQSRPGTKKTTHLQPPMEQWFRGVKPCGFIGIACHSHTRHDECTTCPGYRAPLPCRIGGTQLCWTGVGLWIPTCLHCFTSQSDSPSDGKSAILDAPRTHKLNDDFGIGFNTETVLKRTLLMHLETHTWGTWLSRVDYAMRFFFV